MEPWEVLIKALAEAWAEEDIRSGRFAACQEQMEEELLKVKETANEQSSNTKGRNDEAA